MIRYDPTLVDLTSNFFVLCHFFVLCTKGKVYLYNYLQWVELSMNIHKGKCLSTQFVPLRTYEPQHEISNNVVCVTMCDQQRLRSACAYAQSDQSHC